MLEALAAVLHISDVRFDYEDGNDKRGDAEGVDVASKFLLLMVANLMQVDPEDLFSCLTTEKIITRGKQV